MRFLPLTLLVFSAAACGDEAPPPTTDTPPGNAARGLNRLTGGGATGEPEPEPEPAPAAAPQDGVRATADDGEVPYAYSPIGKRDPFRNIFNREGPQLSEQELTELQKFELDQLRLVAIVSRIPTPFAMVEDPTSKGHTLVRGTLIGKNWGQVSQIKENCVVVREEYRDYTGRKVTNRTPLCLPEPEELKLD